MLLLTACRILCSKEYAIFHVDYAMERNFCVQFLELMPTYYGPDCQDMNIHNHIHVSDDVRNTNLLLSNISAYDLENSLGFTKTLVKMTKNPIAQVMRKLYKACKRLH